MRRTILITLNSIFLIFTGLFIGAIIGVGAMAAPAAFEQLATASAAGDVVGAALRRLNAASAVFLSIMLVVALFEVFYRKRRTTMQILWLRALVVLAAFGITLYLGQVLMPAMEVERVRRTMDTFELMHARYRGIAWFQVLLGALAIVLTNAANIGPRRDGGHPRTQAE